MFKKLKQKFQKLIEQIAEQNKASFGEGELNCCDLNSTSKSSNQNSSNNS